MSSLATAGIVLALVLASAFLGMLLRRLLPDEHLGTDTKDIVKLATGLVGTILALVLGLLIGSAKSYYDTQSAELIQSSAQIILLDRVLAHYGPETQPARSTLRSTVANVLERTWSLQSPGASPADPALTPGESLYEAVQQLAPKTDAQRAIQGQALSIVAGLGQTRWLMYEQSVARMPRPLLTLIVFWLSVLFLSYGLFAPPHATTIATLLLCAVCVAGAILMILEMYDPYRGLIRVSSAPLQAALAQLGK
jgi:hypothetical protein